MSIIAYHFASTASAYHDDAWPIRPETEGDRYYYRLSANECLYCSTNLTSVEELRTNRDSHQIFICKVCGWWKQVHSVVGGQDSSSIGFRFGEAKYYDVDSIEVPIEDLRKYLEKHPKDIGSTNPRKFEHLMAAALKSAYPGSEVTHIGGTGDGGIDIKMITMQNETYLVQVKRRENVSAKEGLKVVRELNGVLFREGVAKGMVITTASDYTPGARKEATSIKTPIQERYEVKLLTFSDVVDMLRLSAPDCHRPWEITVGECRHRWL